MKAMLVVKAKDGYAVAPYAGDIPAGFVQEMTVAPELTSYSYGDSVSKVMKHYFEPPKEERDAPTAPSTPAELTTS